VRGRLPAIVGCAALLAVATMALASGPALADAPRDQGWWTVTNPGGLPAAPPAPPDVPARGLLIQGGPNAPSSFGALVYELDSGNTATTLTLAIAPNSITTPATLQLCALITPLVHQDEGGPLSDAPAYNCSKKATAAATGNQYKFDVSGMMADQLIAVAILPTSPTDRVVFAAPDGSSLASQQGGTSSDAATSPDVGVTSPSEPSVGLPSDSLSSSPLIGTTSGSDTAVPSVGAGGASAPATAAAPGSSNLGGAFVPAVSSKPSKATPLLVALLVAAALGCAALWFYAGRQSRGAVVSR